MSHSFTDPTPAPTPPKKKRHLVRWILLAVIALVVVIIAVSCANSGGTVSGTAAGPSASGGPSSAPSASASAPTSAPPSAQPSNPKFGQTYTWRDGNAVTLTPPEPYKPSNSVVAQQAPNAKAFEVVTVTAKNGTSQPMNPFEVNLQGTSGGQQAPQVFDSPGIVLPTVDIQPGQTLSWKVVFGVQAPDLAVQAQVGFGDSAVQFTG